MKADFRFGRRGRRSHELADCIKHRLELGILFSLQVGQLSAGRWLVSAQNPVHLGEYSEPQPDFMLLKPTEDDYTSRHPGPEDVFLLVEVAETSLDFDRAEKLPAYGRAGVSEVWILNLRAQTLEVYREPHFSGYGSNQTSRAGDTICPAAFPDAVVPVAELLGRAG